jgi:hypothetical protein
VLKLLSISALFGAIAAVYVGTTSHAVTSSVFLGIAAASLMMVCGLLMRAARAVIVEPPPVETAQVTGRRKKELEREKAALLKALKELEFDHEMGKVSDNDFREIGGQYRARAMRVLRQLDEAGADYKAMVEKELQARLGVKGESKAPSVEKAPTAVEQAPTAVEKPADEKEDFTCEGCGTRNDSDAVFCKKCGKKVAA